MSMKSIRDRYKVPAKRGMRIKFQGDPCTITGASRFAEHLTVRFDDDPKRRCYIHPTWAVTYPQEDTP